MIGGIITAAIIITGASYAYWYYYVSKAPAVTPIAQENTIEKPRVFTEEEKLQILEELSATNSYTISGKEKLKILDTLSKQSSEATLSEEEKLQILNSLSQ